MPRRSQVRYFDSRGAYYTQIRGQQKLLAKGPKDEPDGPTYTAALKEMARLHEIANAPVAGDTNSLRVVCELWMQATEKDVTPTTLAKRQSLLVPFLASYGEVPVRHLGITKIEEFLAAQYRAGWSLATGSTFLGILKAALNWAAAPHRKLIPENPIASLPRSLERSRARDCIITPEQHALLLSLCRHPSHRNLLVALENTGCRPGELLAATAADWDDGRGALVYHADIRRLAGEHRHKVAHTKTRTIYFTGEALALMRELVALYPSGPLFRTRKGKGYKHARSLHDWFERLREQSGIARLVPYSYRHTFATRWLMAGKSIDILAELMGNTPAVIRLHYAHLCGDWQGVRAHLEAFQQSLPPAASTPLAERAETA